MTRPADPVGRRAAPGQGSHPPRPLVLLPPSRGKAAGGAPPAYADTLATAPGSLGAPRQRVLEAVVSAAKGLGDDPLRRIAGVRRTELAATRSALLGLASAPTLPARARYTGVVHGNAGLAEVDPATAPIDVYVVSALLGLVHLDEPVPAYRLEVGASLPPLGGLGTFWRGALRDQLAASWAGRPVLDLLPAEHARIITPEVRAQVRVTTVSFRRPDGRAANAARAKVAKGRLVAQLFARPQLCADGFDPAGLASGLKLGEGWSLTPVEHGLLAVYDG
jgi:uncharacterized protein